MAKKDEKLTLRERVKGWWETDTAKAVATIIAVLLIPASVIAWNYATSRADDIRGQLETDGTTISDEETSTDTEVDEEETPTTDANQPEETETGTAQNAQGQEPANTDDANNQEQNNQQPVGGLGSVQTLPNTDSAEYYTVRKGDNIYRISMKVCGNDSYYRSNMNNNYLKVGQTIKVACN